MKASELIQEIDTRLAAEGAEAVITWLQTLAESEELKQAETREKIALLNELGSLCRHTGKLDLSEQAFTRAIELIEAPTLSVSFACASCAPKPTLDLYRSEYATLVNNLAGTYRMQGNFDAALETFRKAKALYLSDENTPADLLASSYNNMGLVYLDLKQYDAALAEFDKASEIIAAIPDNYYVHSVTKANYAAAYMGMGRLAQAADALEASAALSEQAGDSDTAAAYRNMAAQLRAQA